MRARRTVRLFCLVSATAWVATVWVATVWIATAGLTTAWIAAGGCAGPSDRAGDGGGRSASQAGRGPGPGAGRDFSIRPICVVATTGVLTALGSEQTATG